MQAKKVAIIGECMVELSGELFTAMQQNFGGDTMNTAIYLKKLAGEKVDVCYVTAMGEDALSQAMIARWQDYQINCDFVLKDKQRHAGLYMIQTDQHGERSFQYWRNNSAAKHLVQQPKFYNIINKLTEFDAVYLSGISLAILPPDDCYALLNELTNLKRAGVKIIYDSNHRPSLWHSMQYCQDINKRMAQLADLALVTFDDEAMIWSCKDISACREWLHQLGVKELVIKDGGNGCQYSTLEQQSATHYPTNKINKIIDTTAAGDAFNAGFLAAWLQDQAIEECAKQGNYIAGQVIQHYGAIVEITT